MIKCPFCHFSNEDGVLFCEQCKSDLTGVPATSAAPAAPVFPAMPVLAEPLPATPVLVDEILDVVPIEASLVDAEALPFEAIPLEAIPFEAVPVEAVPLAAVPLEPLAAPAVASVMPAMPAMPAMPVPAVTAVPAEPVPVVAAFSTVPAVPLAAQTLNLAAPSAAPLPAASEAPVGASGGIAAGSNVHLKVLRGVKRDVEYPICEGLNFIGRADEKPVDIDLEEQEPTDRVYCSRQHACIEFADGQLFLEDLNSSNGTYVNRMRVHPGQRRPLVLNDVIQIGNVQLKVTI